MATVRGCKGTIDASGSVVAQVTSWDFTETADEIDTTVMGTCTKSSEAGAIKTAGNIACFWDASDAGQDALVVGNTVTVNLYPDGNTTGKVKYTGSVLILSRGVSADVNGLVNTSFTFSVNGALTEGTVV